MCEHSYIVLRELLLKMKKKIWFNRWFSTGVNFIDKIREADLKKEYEIYVTHHNKNKEFIKRADYFEIEKRVRGEEYIDFCIEFCKKHRIDFFIPKFCLLDISKHIKRFSEINVKVLMAANYEMIKLVNDKAGFYEDCRQHNIVQIPEYFIVNNYDEFNIAYTKIKKNNALICYKTAISEGGLDFKIVYENKTDLKKLKFIDDVYKINFNETSADFKAKKKLRAVMVMEYLDGAEYSIDCIAYNGVLLAAVPRKKFFWKRILEEKKELIKLAEKITKIYDFSYVFNVQVKYKNNVPKLLEVNPRMSAGLSSSCKSGINFPFLALELLAKGKADIPKTVYGITDIIEERITPVKKKNKQNAYFEK